MTNPDAPLEVAVLGTGGIGGVLAATLTRAGVAVTPICGSERLASVLRQEGYRVREVDGSEWRVPTARYAVAHAADQARRFDLVLAVTQSTTLAKALADVAPHLAPGGVVVTCQNGLPEAHAVAVVGARVVGCVVGWAASMVEPGVYQRTSTGALQLGRVSSDGPDPAPVARLLEAASEARGVDDLAAGRWSKLAINCVTTTIGAVGGVPLGSLLRHRPFRRLALEVITEVATVAHRRNIVPVPVGGTFDITKIALTEPERHASVGSPGLAYKHSLLLAVGVKYRRLRSSMLYALERGRPPEIDFLNGEIVRHAEELGLSAPVNRALVHAVHRIAAGQAQSSLALLHQVCDDLHRQGHPGKAAA